MSILDNIVKALISSNEQKFYQDLYSRLSAQEKNDYAKYKDKMFSEFKKDGIAIDYITDNDIFINFLHSLDRSYYPSLTPEAADFHKLVDECDRVEDKIYFLYLLKQFKINSEGIKDFLTMKEECERKISHMCSREKRDARQMFNNKICDLLHNQELVDFLDWSD